MQIRQQQPPQSDLKFLKALKLAEYKTRVVKDDLRPISSEITLTKNIAFLGSGSGVSIDIEYDSKLILCLWPKDSQRLFTNDYIQAEINEFKQRKYEAMHELKVELVNDKII